MALAAFGTLGGGQVFAGVAFVGLATGTVLMWVEIGQVRRARRSMQGVASHAEQTPADVPAHLARSARSWGPVLAVGVTVAIAAGAVQTWYTPGTAIAGGDLAPPNGTAWLSHIFSPWVWSGSDLGRPGSLETQLPWAGLLWMVHTAGGSSMLAQRVWYTVLFTGAALGALWLLRLLRASWAAAVVGSLLYLFNPFVLSNVGTNPVFLAALVLVVIVPAIVLSVCSGRWRRRSGAVALVATVPLIGYAYQNPPLVLAVAATGLVATVVSAIWLGRAAGRRAIALLAMGVPLAVLTSLYWLVPSFEQLHFDAVRQLSTLASWTWTETRSTLANAFWLNTSWAWPFKEYVPYNGNYTTLPLSMLRYALPIIGFAALSLRYGRSATSVRQLVLVASASTGSLLVIFVSTGTRLPGSLLFDPIYRLPYGWLLQGPGRFLLLAGVGYAVMATVTVDRWMGRLDHAVSSGRSWLSSRQMAAKGAVAFCIVGAAALAPGYPLAFGAIAPGPRAGSMPSTHVRVPRYWTNLASYLNGAASPPGNLLVLPPDPFYQMLYTWGYYGNDGFITDMIRRNVLDPAGQGYGSAGPALIGAVDQVASSLLAGHDAAANRILRALGTPDVLVRGDIDVRDPVASPDSPRALAAALHVDPAVALVRRFGPLSLYRLRNSAGTFSGVHTGVPYATTQAAAPNLLALSVMSPGTALIRHNPIPGVPAVVQVPSAVSWTLQAGELRTVLRLPPGRSYAVSELATGSGASGAMGLRVGTPTTVGTVRLRMGATTSDVRLSTPVGRNELADGSFASGPWGTVGNCNAVPGKHPDLAARLGEAPPPGAGKALVLSASADIACEAKAVAWRGGPVLVTLSAREVAGRGPALCLWEIGPNRCASLPPLTSSRKWRTYQQAVTPPPGTRGISLFLYAVGGAGGVRSVDDYADVSVRPFPEPAPLVIVATDRQGDRRLPVLTTADSTFGPTWAVDGAAQHVLVDGIANGWLSDTSRRLTPHDTIGAIVSAAFAATLVGAAGTLLLAGSVVIGDWRDRRRGGQR